MAGPPEQQTPGTSDDEIARGKRIGIGCFATFIGFWSGGMIGVLIGKIVGNIRRCVPIVETPVCEGWQWYALAGMILGATTLPFLVLRRLNRKQSPPSTS